MLLVHHHLLGPAQIGQPHVLQLDAQLLGDDLTAGEDGDVLEHLLAPVAKAGSLHSTGVEGTPELVHHQGGQGLTLHVLGDDQEGLTGTSHLLQQGEHVPEIGDLLLMDQDVRLLKNSLHLLGIGDEVGGEVASVKLHTLHHFQGGLQTLGLFHGDDPVFAHLLHGVGNEVTDLLVVVGGDGGHLGDLLPVLDLPAHGLEMLHHGIHGLINAPLEAHGVGAGGNVLHTLFEDGLGQHRSRGGTVTGHIGGLAGHLFHQLGPQVLKLVLQFDLLGHGDTILGDDRRTELLLDNHVPAPGTQGGLHSLGQEIHTLGDLSSNLIPEKEFLGRHHFHLPNFLFFDNGVNVVFPHNQILLSLDLHFGTGVLAVENLVSHLDAHGHLFAAVQDPSITHGHHFPFLGFLLGRIGNNDPTAGLLLFLL